MMGVPKVFPPNVPALERSWGTQEELVGAEGFLLLLFGVADVSVSALRNQLLSQSFLPASNRRWGWVASLRTL